MYTTKDTAVKKKRKKQTLNISSVAQVVNLGLFSTTNILFFVLDGADYNLL